MITWNAVGVVVEGEPIDVSGVNPWNYEWKVTEKESIQLPHPSYPSQMYAMSIYKVEVGGRVILFAAGELSANVWGFYLPA
jgi:hypothetical protein